MTRPPVPRPHLLLPILVVTGAAALVHETAWLRCLMPALGAGAVPAALVSAAVLLGLGFGAAIGGRLADGRARPLHVFAAAETAAALFALAIPAAARSIEQVPGRALPLLLSGLLLTLASTPLGASLPAALRATRSDRDEIGRRFKGLYALNTFGAVGGVLLATGLLLERLGNERTILVASLVQLAVAGGLLVLARRTGEGPLGRSPDEASALPAFPVLAAAFLAGGAGLAVQVAWVRRLLPVVGGTSQSFAAVLATSLFGIALGSLLLGPRRPSATKTRLVLALAALPVAVLPAAIGWLDAWTAERILAADPTPLRLLVIRTAAAGIVLVPSTLLGAAALPWLVASAGAVRETAGRASGALLAANTVGAATLGLTAATWGLPAFGSAAVLRQAAACYLIAAAVIGRGRSTLAFGALGLLLFAQPLVRPIADDALFDAVGATWAPDVYVSEDADRRFAAEGPVATVVVRDREGLRELWVDSKIVASTSPPDGLHLELLGALPMALHADPRRVAVIGLGTGVTAKAVEAWSPEHLDVFELEPAVAAAAPFFEAHAGGVPSTAHVVHADGRHAIHHRADRYDVITSDPIHPGIAGSAWLYSIEHWRGLAARADLVAQWLPLYQLSVDDIRLVARTFAASFEHTYAFLAASDLVLIGAHERLRVDEDLLRRRLASSVGTRLDRFGLRAPGRLLGLLVHGTRGLGAFAGAGPLNTDDRLLLEFSAGRHGYADESSRALDLLLIGREKPDTLLEGPPSARFVAEVQEADRFRHATRRWLSWDLTGALRLFDAMHALDPTNAYARQIALDCRVELARGALRAGRHDETRTRIEKLMQEPDVPVHLRIDAIEILGAAGFEDEAQKALAHLLEEGDWPRARRLLR